VDGVYPKVARFFKMISVRLREMQQCFSKGQASMSKDVEYTFEIFQIKFKPIKVPLYKGLIWLPSRTP